MAEHTPGPWVWERAEGGFCDGHKIRMGEAIGSPHNHAAHLVVEYDHSCYPEDGDGTQHAEAEANARLMAAAPDLLEALENLENDDGAIPDHAWSLVKLAIAKARGGGDG